MPTQKERPDQYDKTRYHNVTTYVQLEKLRLLYRVKTGRRLTQGDLADLLEVKQSTISDWENNIPVSLNRDLLAKLKVFFDCSFDDLLEIGPEEQPEE